MAPRKDLRSWTFLWMARLGVVGLVTAFAGCFSPHQRPCAFTCVSDGHLCPDGFACGADGLCHRDGAEDMCTLEAPYGAGGTTSGGGAGDVGGAAGAAGGGGGGGGAAGVGGALGSS